MEKQNLLLVTGELAAEDLNNLDWGDLKDKFDIKVRTITKSIAAFTTRKDLEKALKEYQREDFDFIIVSGLIPWDVSTIKSSLAKKLRKGPKFFVNLPEIL